MKKLQKKINQKIRLVPVSNYIKKVRSDCSKQRLFDCFFFQSFCIIFTPLYCFLCLFFFCFFLGGGGGGVFVFCFLFCFKINSPAGPPAISAYLKQPTTLLQCYITPPFHLHPIPDRQITHTTSCP